MRAVVQSEAGGTDTLRVDTVDTPEPSPTEVQIKVAAAGLNRADVMQRQGFYPPPPGTTDILGMEVSGTISKLGSDVESWAVGDEVCALLPGGGYAEYATVDAGLVMPLPAGVDLITAAALPEVSCTVFSNLYMTADLQFDELVLIHGGTSGIGSHAIQVAKSHGSRVATTARTDDKLAFCRDLGADILINYTEEDFAETLAPHGADVILDIIGAKYLSRNVSTLAVGGRLVIIGMQGGTKGELNIAELLTKRASVAATNLRGRPLPGPDGKREIVSATVDFTWPKIGNGDIRPIVDRTFDITEVAAAHDYLDSGQAIGKVLLTL